MSQPIYELDAVVRTDLGKGASRRLRRADKSIPGIIYGAKKEAMPITLDPKLVYRALEHEAFYSHILTVKVDGKKERVVLKDMQRHPYKPFVLHMDFLRVSAKEKLTMSVPVHYMNEETCPAVEEGGIVSHHLTEVEISCLPKDLPEYIEFDLGQAQLNDAYHLSDLKLPEGVELTALSHGHDNDQTLVSIHLPKKQVEEEETTEDLSEEEAEGSEEETKASDDTSSEGDEEKS